MAHGESQKRHRHYAPHQSQAAELLASSMPIHSRLCQEIGYRARTLPRRPGPRLSPLCHGPPDLQLNLVIESCELPEPAAAAQHSATVSHAAAGINIDRSTGHHCRSHTLLCVTTTTSTLALSAEGRKAWGVAGGRAGGCGVVLTP
jgi:hypothetical protein